MSDEYITRGECERTHTASDSLLHEMRDDVKSILGRLAPVEEKVKRGGGDGSNIMRWIVGNWPMLARFVGLLGAIVIVGLSGSAKTAKVEEALAQTQRVAQAVATLNETVAQVIPAVEKNAPSPIPLDNAERTP